MAMLYHLHVNVHGIDGVNLTIRIVAIVAMDSTIWITTMFFVLFLVNVETNQRPSDG